MAPARRKSTIQGNFRSHPQEDSLHKNQPKNQARAFLCKITEGKTKPGTKVEAVNSFSEAETKNLEIAFDHRKTVEEAFSILKKNGSITKDEHLNATQI